MLLLGFLLRVADRVEFALIWLLHQRLCASVSWRHCHWRWHCIQELLGRGMGVLRP